MNRPTLNRQSAQHRQIQNPETELDNSSIPTTSTSERQSDLTEQEDTSAKNDADEFASSQSDPAEQEDSFTEENADESAENSQPSAGLEEPVEPAEPDAGSQEDALPTATGETISAPSTGTEAGQSLQIRVVGAPQYDPVADFESAPPELVDTGYTEVVRPEEKGCNRVSVSATGVPLVYRIGVNEDGTIYSASLQSSQSVALEPRDDAAVTCLIASSGITFVRSGDSANKIDDSLLMTFELTEQ